jgi:hypothetical protein
VRTASAPTPVTTLPTRRRRRRRLSPGRLLLAAAAALVLLAAVQVARAAVAGRQGQRALLAAVSQFTGARQSPDQLRSRLGQTRADIATAKRNFAAMRGDLGHAGPALTVARWIPFVRVQVKGADALSVSGNALAGAAGHLVDTANGIVNPADPTAPVSDVLGELQRVHRAVAGSGRALDLAAVRMAGLNGLRLVGPLGHARAQLDAKLPRLQARVQGADQALTAFEHFAGGSGPRTYLLLTQNPDEPRPTGGFIGTYGVLSASDGHLHLDRYDAIENWYPAHKAAVVAQANAPTVFQLAKSDQSLADVNASPDWPTSAQLAARLWQEGGEQPVDGVVSLTPGLLARLLAVVGPVTVPSYGETVTAANAVDRINFYTHQDAAPQPGGRKQFLAALSEQVLQRVLSSPLSKWPDMAQAVADGFHADQAMAWSKDRTVQDTLGVHGWDGAFPEAQTGDFFSDAEFASVTKDGAKLHRVFDHVLEVHENGSARATTALTIDNRGPAGDPGYSPHTYLTVYGPNNAALDPASDTPTVAIEPSVGGHPAAGWQLNAPPLGSATVKVVWEIPATLTRLSGHRYALSIDWLGMPDHTGDVLNLKVALPRGWRWDKGAPPATVSLPNRFSGTWIIDAPAH